MKCASKRNGYLLTTALATALLGVTVLTTNTSADDATKAGEKKVEIKFELPNPIIDGTPKKMPDNVNLQEKTEEHREPFKAPADVTNVAFEKTVTSGDETLVGDLEQITDGDKEGTDGSYVVLNYDTQWVQIDLEKECEIYGIMVWHYHSELRIYRDVIVQVSNDEKFEKDVITLFNNDNDNSSKLGKGEDKEYFDQHWGKLIRVKDEKGFVKGRYVRLYSNGSTADDQNHYIEVEVYGRPAK